MYIYVYMNMYTCFYMYHKGIYQKILMVKTTRNISMWPDPEVTVTWEINWNDPGN